MQWGLDIVGPFPQAIGNRRFFLVAVDYFTKWVEAEALANFRDVDVKKLVWRNIVIRFWCQSPWYRIMGYNLIVRPSASSVAISVSRTGIPPRRIRRVTVELRLQTKQS